MSLFDPSTLGRFLFSCHFFPRPVVRAALTFCYSLRVHHHQPNITVPYAEIVAAAARNYSVYDDDNASIDTAKPNAPHSAPPNSAKRFLSTFSRAAPLMSHGGKRSLSTLAGRLVAHGVFDNGNKRQPPLATLAQLPSAPAIGHAFKGRIVSGGCFQRTTGTSISRRGTSLIMGPANAVIAPWGRLLARLPRKW